MDAWVRLDGATPSGRFWDELNPSPFAHRTPLLDALADEIGLARGDDPLCTVKKLMSDVHTRFEYSPKSTRVDSPIDDALSSRRGVCQDFAHVMIALVRRLGIPCRYVSGYLFQEHDGTSRSVDGATHAWVEAWLPGLEWVGFDPTHNTTTGRTPHPRRGRARLRGRAADARRVQGIERDEERAGRRRVSGNRARLRHRRHAVHPVDVARSRRPPLVVTESVASTQQQQQQQ